MSLFGTKAAVRKCPLLRRLWGLSGHRREEFGRFTLAAAAYDTPPRIASRACRAVGSVPSASSRCLRGPCRRRQARDDFCFPLNHLRRLTGSRREHGLDELDGLLDLLVAHRLDAPPLCSSFISRGTRSARILRYAAGCSLATFSIAFLPCWRKCSSSACMNSWFSR